MRSLKFYEYILINKDGTNVRGTFRAMDISDAKSLARELMVGTKAERYEVKEIGR